jgi:hypothetical protein
MKALLFIIINLGFIITLSAQLNFSNVYRTDSSNTFRTAFTSIITVNDAYYITGYNRDTIDGQWLDRGILTKIDSNGHQLWTRVYGDTVNTMNLVDNDLFITNQGYFGCIGRNIRTSFLLVTDFDGNIIVNKNFASHQQGNFVKINGIAQDDNSNFYLVGMYLYNSNVNTKGILIKTDSLGNELWRTFYEIPPYLTYLTKILPCGNNEFIIAIGKSLSYNYSWSYELGSRLIKIDSSGNILNQYDTPINNRWIEAVRLTTTQDDGVLFYGFEGVRRPNTAQPHYDYYGYVGKLDSSFQLVWEKRYGDFWSTFVSANEKTNGDILLTGVVSTLFADSTQYSGWLIALDENGDSLWQRKYHHFYNGPWITHVADDLEILDNQDLVMAGYIRVGRADTAEELGEWGWLIRTDSFGCIVPGCQLLDNTENIKVLFDNDLTVFPNPASDVVNFKFDKVINEKAVIRVYSGLGQLIGETAIDYSDMAQMRVSDWHSGMYFYGVYVEGVLVKQGQVLVQK